MVNFEFDTWPYYDLDEAEAVKNVLLSNKVNYWTGEHCRKFEKEFSSFADVQHSIAVANGTVALDLALIALGIGEGDEVIVTSRTFLASVSSIVNAGARPVFADVDRDTQNITSASIRQVITSKTRAIVCVHLAGWPCDMDSILALALEFNLYVVEDCAQAHGALYRGKSVGSYGDIGCWSFCQDKIMTTGGEGGMVTTNSEELWRKMWSFKDHGKDWEAVYEKKHAPGFRWVHNSFGTNWRMTEMQAAVGRIQLEKIDGWNQKRLRNAKQIWEAASSISYLRVPKVDHLINSNFDNLATEGRASRHGAYKCYVFVNGDEDYRNRFMQKVNEFGLPCFTGTCSEVYLEKAFLNTEFVPNKRLPIAKELGETSLMFPCNPNITQENLDRLCDAILKASRCL